MATAKQTHMMEWIDDPARLEKTVWLPGGGDPRGTKTGEGEYVSWLRYHRMNPDVFTMAASLAQRMKRAHGSVGSRQIMERFRYELKYVVNRPEGEKDYKLNNAFIPFYGRLLVASNVVPFSLDMFSTKKKGEPGWWVDFLLQLAANVPDAERGKILDRAKSANALRMRGTDEAPPVVMP
jgi:hypothetical protein